MTNFVMAEEDGGVFSSLLESFDDEIPILIDNDTSSVIHDEESEANVDTNNNHEISWSKSLIKLPLFTIKEIQQHRSLSGKVKSLPIAKTLVRGYKFKEERYLKSNSIYTATKNDIFIVKAKCKSSMKKDLRSIKSIPLHYCS